MAEISHENFCGLRLSDLLDLLLKDDLNDQEMEQRLDQARLEPAGPRPSIETLLHAFLPHKYVLHTHAQAILTLGALSDGHNLLAQAFGPETAVLPLIMSGFPLAKAVYEAVRLKPDLKAVVIADHGIFTFDDQVEKAYERMISYAGMAEDYLNEQLRRTHFFIATVKPEQTLPRHEFACRVAQILRGLMVRNEIASNQLTVRRQAEVRCDAELLSASCSPHLELICCSGVVTPDHVIRTKNRYALLKVSSQADDREINAAAKRMLEEYSRDYAVHLNLSATEAKSLGIELTPSVVVISGGGLIGFAPNRREALMAADIAALTIKERLKAMALGGFTPIADESMRATELWAPERSKLSAACARLNGCSTLICGSRYELMERTAANYLEQGADIIFIAPSSAALDRLTRNLSVKYGRHRLCAMTEDKFNKGLCSGFDAVFILCQRLEFKKLATALEAFATVFRRQGIGGMVIILHENASIPPDMDKLTVILNEFEALKVTVRFVDRQNLEVYLAGLAQQAPHC